MLQHQTLLKKAQLAELANGHYRLRMAENPEVLVSDIEFNNRKAARNWARSRGFLILDLAPDGSTMNGPN